MYNCKIIADSKSPQGHRITSMIVTYPRIVHAEMLRHRMFSRNVASSRAIPFAKMVKDVQENPFIPIAWQRDHKGMQGSEYIDSNKLYNWDDIHSTIKNKFLINFEEEDKSQMSKLFDTYVIPLYNTNSPMTIVDWWLKIKDLMIGCAIVLHGFGTTKQLCNRLLEPFMWATELITTGEEGLANFFNQRCPKHKLCSNFLDSEDNPYWEVIFHSWKDFCKDTTTIDNKDPREFTELEKLELNQSQAEIHIQKIAEMMWDAMNESVPKTLQSGEWYIPYGDNIDPEKLAQAVTSLGISNTSHNEFIDTKIKIATARCARLSYKTLGDDPKIDYEADIKLHDRLLKDRHASPMEHIAECQDNSNWYANFKGWRSYRKLLEEENLL